MANGFGSLYVGTSGLQSAQNALNVVSNNLANVDTTGYVRQQVVFSDRHYLRFKDVTMTTNMQQNGLGVSIGDVVHARDIFLDKAYRLENGRQNFYDTAQEVVGQVEDLYQELNGEELKYSLQNLRTGFQQLAEAPSDPVNQNLVIQQSEILLGRFDALYSDLKSYQSNLNLKVKDQVDTINEIGKQIYALNLEVQKVEAGNVETAMTIRDQRDALLDKLSGLVGITYAEDQTGFVAVEIEGTEFIIDSGCYEMGLKTDKTTGFNTPYWPHLSDENKGKYTYVYNYNKYDMGMTDSDGNEVYRLYMDDISTDNNTDVGSLRSILYLRGTAYGTYLDLENPERYATIEDCTLMESEAEIDRLFHYVITTMNDLLCPNTTAGESLGLGANQAITATDASGRTYQINADTKLLDDAHCTVGSDGKKPPQELFTRVGCDRYTEVTDAAGNTYYLYNEEKLNDTSTWYAIGSIEINQNLLSEESLLPMITQNGAVDYALADRLQDAWDELSMTIDPTDNSPCTFEEFYDKMINKLGTDGNVYKTSSETLTTTATGLDNKRLQVTGVSSDEELTHMIKYQAAYNAASRYITVISQMTELIVTGLI